MKIYGGLPPLAYSQPQFAAKQLRQVPQRVDAIEQKLKRLSDGLDTLMINDIWKNEERVLLKVDKPAIMKKARAFLERQAQQSIREVVPFMIGSAGGAASGKTTIMNMFVEGFKQGAREQLAWDPVAKGGLIQVWSMDNAYKCHYERRRQVAGQHGDPAFFVRANLNRPGALTIGQARQWVASIRNGRVLWLPEVRFEDSSRHEGAQIRGGVPFFIAEGLFALESRFLPSYDLTLFVVADKAERYRRMKDRMINDRTSDALDVQADDYEAFHEQTLTQHDIHVEPTRQFADIEINGQSQEADARRTLMALSKLLLAAFYPMPIPYRELPEKQSALKKPVAQGTSRPCKYM